jgi:hypothetical protein
MPDNLIGEIRRSGAVMTYAPGAIMDMRADGGPVSVVVAGLEEWDSSAPLRGNLLYQKIWERRLCKKLNKKYFRLPPVLEDGAKYPGSSQLDNSALVAKRFPYWLQCPKCEIMKSANKWQRDPGRAYRYCPKCTSQEPGRQKIFVLPVRFAVSCNKGHLDDFPWSFWVQHKSECQNHHEYKLSSVGPGLAGLIAKCISCGSMRSLDGAFSKTALSGLSCQGNRPWLQKNDTSCSCNGKDGTYRVVQRGASNLYYPVLESALDIPPWTESLVKILGDYWDTLLDIPDSNDRLQFIRMNERLKAVLQRENISAEKLASTFSDMVEKLNQTDLAELRQDEYRVFTSGLTYKDSDFECYPEEVSQPLKPYISQVVRVCRLREVRVVKGFTRINAPYDGEDNNIAPISMEELDWLPAIEVRGEGIFIALNQSTLKGWENQQAIVGRSATLNESWIKDWESRNPGKPIPFEISPRFLLIHSFAHALIRQLTLECGYSSASLRERMYVSNDEDGMSGVMIYTSTPDSDGTLGGLQRRASPDLLGPTINAAILAMQWCSSDPLCINGEMALPESHSLASCHSCLMLPETSCEFHNRFLDRAYLVGTDAIPDLGFFRDLLES